MMQHFAYRYAVLFSLFLGHADPLLADPEAKGYQIAQEMDVRDAKFDNYRMDMEMVLRDREGQSSTRRIRGAVMEVAGDGDRYLMVFSNPADIKGTAFLSFSHAARADEQWLYLPAVKRTKRIALDSRAGSFMGSEFAFEDLTSQELQKYSFKYLGDDTIEGRASLKVERVPRYEGSGYSRQVVWVDSERYVPLKIDFFNRRGELHKTLSFGEYAQFEGRFWRTKSMHMSNHQNGKSTLIAFSNYRFRTAVAARDFDPQQLEYVR